MFWIRILMNDSPQIDNMYVLTAYAQIQIVYAAH